MILCGNILQEVIGFLGFLWRPPGKCWRGSRLWPTCLFGPSRTLWITTGPATRKIWITSKTWGGLIFDDFEDFFSCFSVFWWLWGFLFMFVFLFQVHPQVQGGYEVGMVSQLTTRPVEQMGKWRNTDWKL